MIELKEELIERKLLNEDACIELGEIKIRFDYPSRSQEMEFRILKMRWDAGRVESESEHWIGYYLRSTIKAVVGFERNKKPYKLEFINGFARDLVVGKIRLDVIAVLQEYDLLESVFGLIWKRLEVTELDKKKLLLQAISSERENSDTGKDSSPEASFSTVGTPSESTAEKT